MSHKDKSLTDEERLIVQEEYYKNQMQSIRADQNKKIGEWLNEIYESTIKEADHDYYIYKAIHILLQGLNPEEIIK